MKFSICHFVWSAVAVIAATLSGSGVAQAEQWTDLEGRKTIRATMLGTWGDRVILRMPNGRQVAVAKEGLRSDSRIQADNLQQRILDSRKSRISELTRAAEAAQSGGPATLSDPDPVGTMPPPPVGGDLQAFLDWQKEQNLKHPVLAGYDGMPVSFRGEVDQMMVAMVESMGRERLDRIRRLLHDVGAAIFQKQNWFLSHPRFKDLPQLKREALMDNLFPVARALMETFSEDAWDMDQLASGNVRGFIETLDAASAPHLYSVFKQVGFQLPTMTAVEEDGKHFVSVNGAMLPYEQTDGVWHGKGLLDQAKSQMAMASSMGKMEGPAATMVDSVLNEVQRVVDTLAGAPDEAAYHVALERLISNPAEVSPALAGMAQPMLSSLAARMPVNNASGGGYGQSGYGDGGYGDGGYGDGGYGDGGYGDGGYGGEINGPPGGVYPGGMGGPGGPASSGRTSGSMGGGINAPPGGVYPGGMGGPGGPGGTAMPAVGGGGGIQGRPGG